MPADIPAPPPEAVLIRRVRVAAGMGIPEAARRAGISVARWSQVENGRETRKGVVKAVRAKPGTIAHMAGAVGIDAERLEAEGEHPEAAAVLREMDRPHLAAVPSLPPEDAQQAERADAIFPELPPEARPAALLSYWDTGVRMVTAAEAEAGRRGIPLTEALAEIPAGRAVFPDLERERSWWDSLVSRGLPSGRPYTYEELARNIAILRWKFDRAGSAESASAGLAALLQSVPRRVHPGFGDCDHYRASRGWGALRGRE